MADVLAQVFGDEDGVGAESVDNVPYGFTKKQNGTMRASSSAVLQINQNGTMWASSPTVSRKMETGRFSSAYLRYRIGKDAYNYE